MVRKRDIVLLGILVIIFLVVASLPYFVTDAGNLNADLTGNSIRETVGSFYETSSVNQRIFILTQILLVIIIVIAAVIIFGRVKPREKISRTEFFAMSSEKRSQTDLDILYEMLKKKGEIKMEDVEDAFKIKSEIVIGWFKVLEEGNLAEIDYPRFGKPVLKLICDKEKEDTEKEEVETKIVKNDDAEKTVKGEKNVSEKRVKGEKNVSEKRVVKKIIVRRKVGSKKKTKHVSRDNKKIRKKGGNNLRKKKIAKKKKR